MTDPNDYFVPVIFYQQVPNGTASLPMQPWGHAGWIQISATGNARYFEFGPYATNGGGAGQLREVDLTNSIVSFSAGKPDITNILRELSNENPTAGIRT